MAREIIIYGRPNCAHCIRATELMKIKKWPYQYVNLMELEPSQSFEIVRASGMKTFPMVKVDNVFIGGADQLEAYVRGKEQEAM